VAQLLDDAGALFEQPLLEMVSCFLLSPPPLGFSFVDFVGIIGFRPFFRRDAGAQS